MRKRDFYDYRKYDNILEIDWPPVSICSNNLPSTKPTRFLQNFLHLDPIEDFYRGYDITIAPEEQKLAEAYIEKLPKKPVVIIHYLAKTLKESKSLTHADAAFICDNIQTICTPVILDWKNESPLPDNKTIFNPGIDDPIWQGEHLASAGTIAALISRANLYIGVDSGPLHVAGCTKTPTLAIWHGHHPVNFFDICDNVTHLIPIQAKESKGIQGSKKLDARDYFEKTYKYIYYKNLGKVLLNQIKQRLKII